MTNEGRFYILVQTMLLEKMCLMCDGERLNKSLNRTDEYTRCLANAIYIDVECLAKKSSDIFEQASDFVKWCLENEMHEKRVPEWVRWECEPPFLKRSKRSVKNG